MLLGSPLAYYLVFLFLSVLDTVLCAREVSINVVWGPFYAFFYFLCHPEFMPVAWPALLCCALFAWLWWTSSGIKSAIYYILMIFFSLSISIGPPLYSMRNSTMPGGGDDPPINPIPYFIVWALFVGCILAYELYSRHSAKK